jgi:hypothetical protein
MLQALQRIKCCGLAPNQKIHAIKIFIIPKLHYSSTDNIIRQKDLQVMDQKLRNTIN